MVRKLVYGESLLETLSIPLRIFFQGQDDIPALFDGRLNPYLLVLAPFGLMAGSDTSHRVKLEKRILISFAVLFILIVFLTRDMRIRYIAPAIPSLVILSIHGLYNINLRILRMNDVARRRYCQWGLVFLLVAGIGWNGIYLAQLFSKVRPLDYLSGKLNRDAYIETFRPEYAVIQYTNRTVKDDGAIACIFLGNRRYYFDGETRFFDWSDISKTK